MRLILEVPPLLNRLYHPFRGRMVLDEKAVAYKNAARWEMTLQLREQGQYDPCPDPLELDIRVYRPRNKGDVDAVLKLLLDSMNQVVYVDDAQVMKVTIEKFTDPIQPRVEVGVKVR